MSTQLTHDDFRDLNPICSSLIEIIHLVTEFWTEMVLPSRLMNLANQNTFQVHIFKNINSGIMQNQVVANSKIVIESVFATSEKTLIHNLFSNITNISNVSLVSLTYTAEENFSVIAASIFAMCHDGCYISYVAVVERDIFGVTNSGYFCDCGIGRLLICVIQLVSFMNFNTWNMYCWSNNNKKKKDMWYKLGFQELHSINGAYWSKSIEDCAIYFHLPKNHALKSNLIPKGIKCTIPSFDIEQNRKKLQDMQCDSRILSLHYYKNGWFDYSTIKKDLQNEDTRTLCISWIESNTILSDIQEGSPDFAIKVFYNFQQRLKIMEDTITISSEIQDLREISDEEGFMSEIAMDYCMMAMFFKVKNVYPIHTHCFNI
jgi:hypothetical protein